MSFLGEVKRRKVFQVAAVYLVASWLIIQIVDVVAEPLLLPAWFPRVVIVLLAVGFPIAVILSWAYDLTSGGVERTGPKTRGESGQPETMPATTGLAVNLTVIGVLATLVMLVGLYVLWRNEPATMAGADTGSQSPALVDNASGVLPNSVAVLLCDNLSPDPDDAFFAAGIHEEILNQLFKLRSLNVIARTSVLPYADSRPPIPQIAEELNVETVMECSVRSAGDAIVVTAQLINPETNTQMWSQTYPGDLSDLSTVFAIQADIATNIATELQATLSPDEVERLNEVPTQNELAWRYYQQGKEYFWSADFRNDTPLAVQFFQQAVDEDDQFAEAFGALARAHIRLYARQNIDRTETRLRSARAAADTATRLAPDSPETHLAWGVFHYMATLDFDTALGELGEAELGMPGSVEILIAQADIYRRQGRHAESNQTYQRALELDPRNSFLLWLYAENLQWTRDYDRSDDYVDRALRLSPDDIGFLNAKLQIPLFRHGDVSLLREAAENLSIPLGEEHAIYGWTASIFERDFDTALDYLEDIENGEFNSRLPIPLAEYIVGSARLQGVTNALAGNFDTATEYFQVALAQHQEIIGDRVDEPELYFGLGEVRARLGDSLGAVQAANEGLRLAESRGDYRDVAPARLQAAYVLLLAGDLAAGIRMLDTYLDNPGRWSIEGLKLDPRLDFIQDDPDFRVLVEKYSRQ